MSSLPYDRQRTSMGKFGLCPQCRSEYGSPDDRRFHHQTVCCPACGPSYRLYAGGKEVGGDPIGTYARMLDDGKIGVSKGWGGMHISCILSEIPRLRKKYSRPSKPFAVMVRDIQAAERYAHISDAEKDRLLSPQRPIVLVEKKDIPEEVSPGIDTVGMFLPYTGMQHILFSRMDHDIIVMTSANEPGEPMIIDNGEAFGLGADMYLLHDQDIVQRADDTVLRMCGEDTFFLRKSRGYVPCSYDTGMKGDALAVGAQENLAAAVAVNGRIYPTQYIGNGEGVGVPEYLDSALRHMMEILGPEPAVIAEDLHPMYANRSIASALAEEIGAEIIDVQHHWAHAASLMVDVVDTDGMSVIVLDGTGHGDDGNAWGGEVLSCDMHGYKRLAHLEYLPLIGGQKAVTDIRRLRLAIDLANGVRSETGFTDSELSNLRKLAQSSVRTSSFGRMLDAVSYSEGICRVRTYDGEPAMRLERYLDPDLKDHGETGTANGSIRFAHLFEDTPGETVSERATFIVRSVLREMTDIACDDAASKGYSKIGITGGVSYDVPVVTMVREMAARRGMGLAVHGRIPNGDGGISAGQAAIALSKLRSVFDGEQGIAALYGRHFASFEGQGFLHIEKLGTEFDALSAYAERDLPFPELSGYVRRIGGVECGDDGFRLVLERRAEFPVYGLDGDDLLREVGLLGDYDLVRFGTDAYVLLRLSEHGGIASDDLQGLDPGGEVHLHLRFP